MRVYSPPWSFDRSFDRCSASFRFHSRSVLLHDHPDAQEDGDDHEGDSVLVHDIVRTSLIPGLRKHRPSTPEAAGRFRREGSTVRPPRRRAHTFRQHHIRQSGRRGRVGNRARRCRHIRVRRIRRCRPRREGIHRMTHRTHPTRTLGLRIQVRSRSSRTPRCRSLVKRSPERKIRRSHRSRTPVLYRLGCMSRDRHLARCRHRRPHQRQHRNHRPHPRLLPQASTPALQPHNHRHRCIGPHRRTSHIPRAPSTRRRRKDRLNRGP